MSTMGRGFWVLDKINALRDDSFSKMKAATLFQPTNTIRYRYPSGARGSITPKYPRPSVLIDYFLPESPSGIKLEIKNKRGDVIASFLSDTTKNKIPDQILTDMSTNSTEYLISKSLGLKKGINRFSWDMTMTGAWHKEKNRRFKNGPMVKPGEYIVELTVNDKVLAQSFEITMDPRNEKVNITADHISQQVDFQVQLRDLLSDANRLENKLEKQKKKNEENTALNEGLAKLKTEKGIYMKPMLIDQISYLNYMISGADQIPGKDAYDRYEELKAEFDELESASK